MEEVYLKIAGLTGRQNISIWIPWLLLGIALAASNPNPLPWKIFAPALLGCILWVVHYVNKFDSQNADTERFFPVTIYTEQSQEKQ